MKVDDVGSDGSWATRHPERGGEREDRFEAYEKEVTVDRRVTVEMGVNGVKTVVCGHGGASVRQLLIFCAGLGNMAAIPALHCEHDKRHSVDVNNNFVNGGEGGEQTERRHQF
ncbi:hypothetical protein GWI33_000365 [Rhynchophorus ferrugineus]|uniref:Uncharacterized protein n=1 Tax=Rhynchophorus ferrugineus TaxID=354439 RepID=A0A834HMA1_RHYFE|nr:hypothetical protein GWI33_000365 [Rhynchophorus ferrugineus]